MIWRNHITIIKAERYVHDYMSVYSNTVNFMLLWFSYTKSLLLYSWTHSQLFLKKLSNFSDSA